MDELTETKKVAIIGSGVIGQYWAMIFAAGGHRVSLFDIDGSQVSRALDFIKEKLKSYEKQGRLRGTTSADHQFQLISGHTDLSECVDEACYIQECAPESVEVKTKVFLQLDNFLTEKMVAASSSSCLGPSSLQEECSTVLE